MISWLNIAKQIRILQSRGWLIALSDKWILNSADRARSKTENTQRSSFLQRDFWTVIDYARPISDFGGENELVTPGRQQP